MTAPRSPVFDDFAATADFVNYTPAVTSSVVGSMTLGIITAKYKLISYKTYLLLAGIQVLTKGTSGGFLFVDLPFQCANEYFSGIVPESTIGSYVALGIFPSTSRTRFAISKLDFTTAIADGVNFRPSFIFTT